MTLVAGPRGKPYDHFFGAASRLSSANRRLDWPMPPRAMTVSPHAPIAAEAPGRQFDAAPDRSPAPAWMGNFVPHELRSVGGTRWSVQAYSRWAASLRSKPKVNPFRRQPAHEFYHFNFDRSGRTGRSTPPRRKRDKRNPPYRSGILCALCRRRNGHGCVAGILFAERNRAVRGRAAVHGPESSETA